MRIVKLNEFIAMPPGTLFAKYQPCAFEDLCIKGDSILETQDFFYQQIVDAIDASGSDEWSRLLHESQETGKSLPMNFHYEGRDGCFEPAQLFAVWERADVEGLIARLRETLGCEAADEIERLRGALEAAQDIGRIQQAIIANLKGLWDEPPSKANAGHTYICDCDQKQVNVCENIAAVTGSPPAYCRRERTA